MKGGVASSLFAVETLHRAGVRLRGDVVYCANTDEESSGAGSLACVQHGVAADAGICGEPTGFDVWVCCRGTVMPIITVEGRAGHAEMPQPHWRDGGAVNAIEKAAIVLEAIEGLRAEWRGRADKRHWCLAPGDIVPTVIEGGVWTVTYPPHCSITCDVQYLPANVDAEGTAKGVEAELRDWIDARAAADPWLREHPLRWRWMEDIVPAEVPAEHPIVATVQAAGAALGRTGRICGPRLLARRRPLHALGQDADRLVRARRHRQRPRGRRARLDRRAGRPLCRGSPGGHALVRRLRRAPDRGALRRRPFVGRACRRRSHSAGAAWGRRPAPPPPARSRSRW